MHWYVHGIIDKPQDAWISNLTFGGPNLDILYATSANAVYKRRLNTRGVLAFEEPIKPPKPRL